MTALKLNRLWFLEGRKMALWSESSRSLLQHQTRVIAQQLAPAITRS